jgi:hypothetical protein
MELSKVNLHTFEITTPKGKIILVNSLEECAAVAAVIDMCLMLEVIHLFQVLLYLRLT